MISSSLITLSIIAMAKKIVKMVLVELLEVLPVEGEAETGDFTDALSPIFNYTESSSQCWMQGMEVYSTWEY